MCTEIDWMWMCLQIWNTQGVPTFYFLRSQPISPLLSSQPCLGLPRPSGHQQDDSTQGLDTQIGWSTNRRVEDLEKKSQQILLQGTWEEPDVCWESLLQTDTELSGKILTDRVSDDRPVFISPERVRAMGDPNLSRCRLPRNKPILFIFS